MNLGFVNAKFRLIWVALLLLVGLVLGVQNWGLTIPMAWTVSFSWLSLVACLLVGFASFLFTGLRGALSLAGICFSLATWQGGKLWAFAVGPQSEWMTWARDVSWLGASVMPLFFMVWTMRIGTMRTAQRSIIGFTLLSWLGLAIAQGWGLIAGEWVDCAWGFAHAPGQAYPLFLLYYAWSVSWALFWLLPLVLKRVGLGRWGVAGASLLGLVLGSLEFVNVLYGPQYPWADLAPMVYAFVLAWALLHMDVVEARPWLRLALEYGISVLLLTWLIVGFHAAWSTWGASVTFLPAILLAALLPWTAWVWTKVAAWLDPVGRVKLSDWQYFYLWIGRQNEPDLLAQELVQLSIERGFTSAGVVLIDPDGVKWYGQEPSHWVRKKGVLVWGKSTNLLQRGTLIRMLRFQTLGPEVYSKIWAEIRFLARWEADLWLPLVHEGQFLGAIWFREKSTAWVNKVRQKETLLMVGAAVSARLAYLTEARARVESERLAEVGFWTAALAHQLKNPLEGILGAAEVLSEDPMPEMIEIVRSEALKMNDRIHLFLNWSRDEKVCAEVIELERGLYRSFRLDGWSVLGDTCSLWADPKLLEQITEVLKVNAHKYGKAPFYLECQVQADFCELSFRDSGKGVAQPDMLFKPFRSTSSSGHGLGLVLARKLALAMGGSLSYNSKNQQGAEFRLRLPVYQVKE